VANLNGTSAATFSTQVAAKGIAIFTEPTQAQFRSLPTLLGKSNQASDLLGPPVWSGWPICAAPSVLLVQL
jgi:hypothetical protein